MLEFRGTPQEPSTELWDLARNMVGAPEAPNFDAKGAETMACYHCFVDLVKEFADRLPGL